jgi:hypothetical protein
MDLENAFVAVGHLASRHRLLIGRGYMGEENEQGAPLEMDWGSGDIRDIPRLRGLEFVSEIGLKLLEIYDDYMADMPRALTSITWTNTNVTFIVLGAESPVQIAMALRSSAEDLLSTGVEGYLSERFSDWKRPLAQVLPFRGRKRDGDEHGRLKNK